MGGLSWGAGWALVGGCGKLNPAYCAADQEDTDCVAGGYVPVDASAPCSADTECTAAGKKAIDQVVDESQAKVNADVVSGKVVAMLADSPVGLYAVKQTTGQLEALGQIYDAAPYGIVVRKSETAFAHAIADAFTALNTSGDYKKTLTTWGNDTGAINTFAGNP